VRPQPLDFLARIERSIHVHHERGRRMDDEAICTRDARRIQQSVDSELAEALGRPLEPECRKDRKLLGSIHAAVDGEAARRDAILHLATHRAEVARTEERDDVANRISVGEQPEAGEAQILRQARTVEPALAVVEHRGIVGDLARLTVYDLEHADGRFEEQPEVEELRLEAKLLFGPQRVIDPVRDGLMLVPVKIAHLVGNMARGRTVWSAC
jgi:hypothetical protein